jgi:hypothetical protein
MRRGHTKTKHGRRERDPDRMAWTSMQPCAVAVDPPANPVPHLLACSGRVEVDHAAKKVAGFRRNDEADRDVIPLCSKHHAHRTGIVGGYGVFDFLSREARREWTDRQIARMRSLYAEQGEVLA